MISNAFFFFSECMVPGQTFLRVLLYLGLPILDLLLESGHVSDLSINVNRVGLICI